MTLNAKSNPHEAIEQILSAGLDGLPSAIAILVNEAMIIERNRYLDADPYERTDSRVSYGNGYKPRTLKTRSGMLSLQVPQTRDSLFYPSILDKGMRSERALKLSIAEMYFTGVATRKVKRIMELSWSSKSRQKIKRHVRTQLWSCPHKTGPPKQHICYS